MRQLTFRNTRSAPSSSPSIRRTSRNAAASFFRLSISSTASVSKVITQRLTIFALCLGLVELSLVERLIILSKQLADAISSPSSSFTHPKRYVLPQTMQWIGWLGVERIVHTGNDLGAGRVTQS